MLIECLISVYAEEQMLKVLMKYVRLNCCQELKGQKDRKNKAQGAKALSLVYAFICLDDEVESQ
jgi:hypothetical protein